MLTSFYESYLLLIQGCALVCLLANLYHFAQYLYAGVRGKRQRGRVERIKRDMRALLKKNAQNGRPIGKRRRAAYARALKRMMRYGRKLRRGAHLRALNTALRELGYRSGADIPLKLRVPLQAMLDDNLRRIGRGDDAARALFITAAGHCGLDTPRYDAYLLSCMRRAPLYLQIAALRGCARTGGEALMLRALTLASERGEAYSAKLLTDVLMLFRGDRDALNEAMWRNLRNYSVNLARGLIDLLTGERVAAFAPRMRALMLDEGADKELRLAAIRYYGAVYDENAEEPLAAFLGADEWEYAAAAARALENYPCERAWKRLIAALCSKNWYVRANSAMTLVKKCPSHIGDALKSEDRFARDIVHYALDVRGGDAA